MTNRIPETLPAHIAVVMDGNGRWAKKRAMPRGMGHAAGSEAFERNAEFLSKIGLRYLTVYAFSTENWKRPLEEVESIFALLRKYMNDACAKLVQKNMKLRFIGDLAALPDDIGRLADNLHELSKKTTGMQVNIALNYGGRSELAHAFEELAKEKKAGKIGESDIERHLYTAGIPDPDLLIRPGAEKRISNFLLWQLAYTEIYFSDILWPDFKEKDLINALTWYAGRNRRFGGI